MGQQEGNPHDPGWETPEFVLNRVRKAFGGQIGLDPASTSANPTKASTFFAEKGLEWDWEDHKVFLNPPWGRKAKEPIRQWLSKAADHGNTIAICGASTNALWYHLQVWNKASAVCFPRGRISYAPSGGTKASTPKHDTCIVCYSSKVPELRERFYLAFETMGRVVIL